MANVLDPSMIQHVNELINIRKQLQSKFDKLSYKQDRINIWHAAWGNFSNPPEKCPIYPNLSEELQDADLELCKHRRKIQTIMEKFPEPTVNLWEEKISSHKIIYTCLKCGYGFMSEHTCFDKNSHYYTDIKSLVINKQKEHEYILCDPERCTHEYIR